VVRKVPRIAFYFTQSATTGFIASVFPSRSRVSFKEAFAGPELCDRKLSRTVLRGLDGSNPVRLLGNLSRPVLRGLEASNGLRLLGNSSRRRSRTPNQLSRVVAKFLVALSGSTIYSAVGLLLAALGGLQWDG